MRRWQRVLICLLLVCCILVNLSPLRAEAVSATAVACSVAIPVAVAVGLNALGIRQGSSSTAFNQVVNNCVDALSSSWAVNGLTTMLALTTDGVTNTFANRNFLQAILDFIFAENIVSSQTPAWGKQFNVTFNGVDYEFSSSNDICLVAFQGWTPTAETALYVFGNSSAYQFAGGWRYLSQSDYGYYYGRPLNKLSHIDVSGVPVVTLDTIYETQSDFWNACVAYGPYGLTEVTTSEDLTLESVGDDIETDYETYVEEGIISVDFGVQFEDDPETPDNNEEENNNIPYVPVRIPSTSTDSYIDQTQAEAQTGNTPQDVLDTLLQNSGSGDSSGNGSGDGSGPGSGSTGSLWSPPSDHNQFALADLSKFFPFCIPFDLYDFFTLLNAEPVAPVLSWEIKDLAGQTYSLDVDLSQWDSVAQLFRRLQLFLFITGLAAASRKFIKW